MCGIAGFLEPQPNRTALEMHRDAAAMAQTLRHRGPDDEGIWVDGEAGVALAHRRLSILDLSEAGRQPMHSACGRYALIANGEIYNFQALRRELETHGIAFRGHCDTEVMLAAISQWGLTAALEKFDGMFAFALWDKRQRLLHLGRDRIGEKPLYYGWTGGAFVFASELKALRRHPRFEAHVDRDALALYLRYAYLPAPYSIYRGIRKVMPGSTVTIGVDSRSAEPQARTYWSCKEAVERGLADPFRGSAADAGNELASLLEASVKLRTQADVPVGAFLSGGYDSSTIVSMMQRLGGKTKTFTLGFEEQSEAPFAREVARVLGTDHVEAHVTPRDALNVIPELPRIYDEPFSDSSQIPTVLISRLARRQVSVILTGDAGDELFCGYGRYDISRYPGNCEAARIDGYRTKVSKWLDPAQVMAGVREAPVPLTSPAQWIATGELAHQMMYLDTIAYLPDDLLVKVDRAAMSVGLETRVPFLDHRIVEFAWRLPFEMKVNAGERKWILRQVLYRDVPPSLVDRPKQGFEVPLKTWLMGPLRDWAETLLDETRLRHEGYFHPAAIREEWDLLADGPARVKHALWAVLMFQAWLDDARVS